jgi:hypothetical protein
MGLRNFGARPTDAKARGGGSRRQVWTCESLWQDQRRQNGCGVYGAALMQTREVGEEKAMGLRMVVRYANIGGE